MFCHFFNLVLAWCIYFIQPCFHFLQAVACLPVCVVHVSRCFCSLARRIRVFGDYAISVVLFKTDPNEKSRKDFFLYTVIKLNFF